jgi:hypothetical protein
MGFWRVADHAHASGGGATGRVRHVLAITRAAVAKSRGPKYLETEGRTGDKALALGVDGLLQKVGTGPKWQVALARDQRALASIHQE